MPPKKPDANDDVRGLSMLVMKVNELLANVHRVYAQELEKLAIATAPAVHIYGKKASDSLYAVELYDTLFLRSDSQFAETTALLTISYMEVVARYDIDKIRRAIFVQIKKFLLLQDKHKKLDIDALKSAALRTTRSKPRKPRHLHAID